LGFDSFGRAKATDINTQLATIRIVIA